MVDDQTTEESNLDEYDEVLVTMNTHTVDAFSSCVIPIKTEKAYMGEHINNMTQVLQTKDGSLLQGLSLQNTYTELSKGNKNAVAVVRNSMAYPQTLKKENPSGQSSGCNCGARTAGRGQVAGRGMSPRTLMHLNWQLDRDKGSYLKS